MTLAEFFLDQLEKETASTRNALARVPDGHDDWRPHHKSMPLGYLAALVATMPAWIAFVIDRDDLDISSPEGEGFKPRSTTHPADLLRMLDDSVLAARSALSRASDEHLMKPWKFIVAGHVASELPRYAMIRDSVFSHLAHHRGQLTVYLRLNGASVPAIYGPSADEGLPAARQEAAHQFFQAQLQHQD